MCSAVTAIELRTAHGAYFLPIRLLPSSFPSLPPLPAHVRAPSQLFSLSRRSSAPSAKLSRGQGDRPTDRRDVRKMSIHMLFRRFSSSSMRKRMRGEWHAHLHARLPGFCGTHAIAGRRNELIARPPLAALRCPCLSQRATGAALEACSSPPPRNVRTKRSVRACLRRLNSWQVDPL